MTINLKGDELWTVLGRFVAGESSAEEAEAVRRWLAEEPSRAELLTALDGTTRRLAFRPPADLDVEAALRSVSARLNEPDVLPLRPRAAKELPVAWWRSNLLRVAALVTLLLGGALLWRVTQEPGDEQVVAAASVFETRVGERRTVRLDDGTLVQLAPASRLITAAGYGVNARAVQLQGEALFDVPHDEQRPFTVRAAHATIEDLGTTFTVRSDADDEVRVVVTVGSVRLMPADTPRLGVILRAGDRGVLPRGGPPVAQRAAASQADIAWTRGKLVFENARLTRVAADLRRWYGIELRIEDPGLAERHLTAAFENESKDQVLKVIGLALGAQVEQRGDTAIVRALPTREREQ